MATRTDFTIPCKSAHISPSDKNEIYVEISDGIISEVLNAIEIEEAISHYGNEDVLKEVGLAFIMQHFDLIEQGKYDDLERKLEDASEAIRELKEQLNNQNGTIR